MATQPTFRVGLVQMAMSREAGENLEKAVARVREAARAGAEVVCLPELFRSPYFCQKEDPALFDLAEPVAGPRTEALGRAARESGVALVAPIFERRAAGLYHNSAVILDADGTVAGLYRKMHIPDDPLFYEKFYFPPGDLGFLAFDTKPGRIGALICWDQWYPEGARLTALRGAAVLFYPTAIGWHPHEKAQHGPAQRSAWQTIQRSHAIANGVYVAVGNRVGHEIPPEGGPGLAFWGSAFLAHPFRVVVAVAVAGHEEILGRVVRSGRAVLLPHGRRRDPRLRARVRPCRNTQRPGRHRRLPVQRLGEVPGLEKGRAGQGARGPGPEDPTAARGVEGKARRPRRGQHRRERPGHPAHHRGVPARPERPGAEPGLRPRGLRRHAARGPRGHERPLAGQGDRRGRHPRPRGRPRAFRERADDRARAREEQGRREPPAPRGEPRTPRRDAARGRLP